MDWITTNLAEAMLIAGLVLLGIEIAILGFSTFVLFFVGIAALLTSLLLFIGLLPDSPLVALLSTAILTAIAAALLWKPLKNMQTKSKPQATTNDLVGHRFVLSDAISKEQPGSYQYSGIQWKLISEQPLEAGTEVEVVKTDVGVFFVSGIA
jgi:membrane protein implicated in regulation of membrane protease activity